MEKQILIAGFGGQGVMMLGKLLSFATCEHTDKNITFFPSYGAQQRGGTANCFVTISDDPIGAPLGEEQDDLIILNEPSLDRFLKNVKPGGNLFVNSSLVKKEIARDDVQVIEAPVTDLALELGSPKVVNIVMLGVYIGYENTIDEEIMRATILKKLGRKPALIPLNEAAFARGLEIGKAAREKKRS